MRLLILLWVLFSFLSKSLGQNLVSNPSFEMYSICPTNIAQIANATNWQMVSGHAGSPDFFHTCATSGLINVPNNAFGSQAPATGNGYAGLAMFYQSITNFREYLQTQLTSPLVAGTTYEISFKASLGDNSEYAGSDFSIYLSNNALTWAGGGWSPINTVTPQVAFPTYIGSLTNWVTLTATYTAIGGEQYLVLGNFKDDVNTLLTYIQSATYTTGYYYVDDFVVQELMPLPLELLSFSAHKSLNNSILLNWKLSNTSTHGDFEIQRSENGNQFTTIGNVAKTGGSDYTFRDEKPFMGKNYYRLKQIDIEGKISYSNIIAMDFDAENNDIWIAPNPVENTCTVFLGNIQNDTQMYLMDTSGKILKNYTIIAEPYAEITLDLSDLASGMYFLHISNKKTLSLAKK